ncbi:hypothetical protein E8F11_23015 [Pseudomonas sp. BN417]|uniref:hypothetical protein n=1 Tax=Pseudomonas sp. BN417 TaxID=2567890 RepID=UPI0024562AF5|nr:hypothetical protein [Pseudomonas sp. BN417]MDH4558011.1 hypothetical protein [Pseudomonas sp. BN417]
MRSTVMLCLLYLLSAMTWGDGRSDQQLSELASRSQLLCASSMLYFNPEDRAPDPRSLTVVFHHLGMLETYVLQLGQPTSLVQPLQAMKRTFAQLEAVPASQRQHYPELLRQLLLHRQQLQRAVVDIQTSAPQSGSPTTLEQRLNAQSQALASLLMDYQLRFYPMPDKPEFALTREQVLELDRDIDQRFETLRSERAEQAEALARIRGNYQFVRAQLLQDKGRAHGGVEFYLSRAVADLDELATTTLATDAVQGALQPPE